MLFIEFIRQLLGALAQLEIDIVGFVSDMLPEALEKAAPLILLLGLFRFTSDVN